MFVFVFQFSYVGPTISTPESAGADHIHAEHLIHASDRLTVLLSILCTSIMKHGYIPSGMLDTTLTPIVKTKTGDVTDKNIDP